MNSSTSSRGPGWKSRVVALWPQVPLSIVLALVGGLNLLVGLSVPLTALEQVRAFTELTESLSATRR